MSQQMFGQQGGMYGQPPVGQPASEQPAQDAAADGTSAATQPPTEPANSATQPVTQPGVSPPVNPFAQMMQQMMQNPQMMQNAMQMNPMFGPQGGFGQNPMFGNFGAPAPGQGGAMDEAAVAAAASNPMVRARFQMQLENLLAMRFSDEQKCLQALVQCDGNVDRALDRLFADN